MEPLKTSCPAVAASFGGARPRVVGRRFLRCHVLPHTARRDRTLLRVHWRGWSFEVAGIAFIWITFIGLLNAGCGDEISPSVTQPPWLGWKRVLD